MENIIPRPHQEEILQYTHGTMGISAVPGSGKTWTLSALGAKLITNGFIDDRQEILIVTLTNSAVDNFSTRINEFLQYDEYSPLIPPYRVRTLHGLAHDIVRERPDLVGLDSNFVIIDEREAEKIREDIISSWLHANPLSFDPFISSEIEGNRLDWIRREQIPLLLKSITFAFNRTAKDMQRSPEQILEKLDQLPISLPLAELSASMYLSYQRALAYRGAVDFDDLIRFALMALNTDHDLLMRLQNKWPYILEDEAQDSSLLQEEILHMLTGNSGNWIRVGDPNQAIFESFTTANPRYLRDFMKVCDYPRHLPSSGRSTQSIISLANRLIDWSKHEHPVPEIRGALDEPYIQPTGSGDPQPNPPDHSESIFFTARKFTPSRELNVVVDSLERWLKDHPEETVAVLVPRNQRGFLLIDILRDRKIEVVDSLLRSTSTTRFAAGAIGNLLRYLGDPGNPRKLATVFQVWKRHDREDPEIWVTIEEISTLIENCTRVEDFIWPHPDRDWLNTLELPGEDAPMFELLEDFRALIRRWQGTVLLPVNQIIITIAQDLFEDPAELALAHKLAVLLRQAENSNPNWRLSELAGELAIIARNERRFLGFGEDDTGFDPENYKGKVVVATVHKAKGLEWDRVYLLSVNNYDFPSGMEYDNYIGEKWYIENKLNLEAETLSQLKFAFYPESEDWYEEGKATLQARWEYVRERLRLFYVGITRAKKELVVTWNNGRKSNLSPSIPFIALQTYLEELEGSTNSDTAK
jgi:DNA helicase-2/ATP-dependent DNA helicase PcrA